MTTSLSEEVVNDKIQNLTSSKEVILDSDTKKSIPKEIALRSTSAEIVLTKNPKITTELDPPKTVNGDSHVKPIQVEQIETNIAESPVTSLLASQPHESSSNQVRDDSKFSPVTPEDQTATSMDPSNPDKPKKGSVANEEVSQATDSSTLPMKAQETDLVLSSSADQPAPDTSVEQLSDIDVPDKHLAESGVEKTLVETTSDLNEILGEESVVAEGSPTLDSQIEIDIDVESPVPPAPVELEPASQAIPDDSEMTDAPKFTTKSSREREDDDDEIEPSAKRAKITDESSHYDTFDPPPKVEVSSQSNQSASREVESTTATTITAFQTKELIKILRNIARTNAGKNFRQPVSVLWPTIADNYAAKIPHPMDLSTIERKLKEEAYATISDIKADVHLIYNNSVIFNSAENPVSKCAMETRNALFSKFSSIPAEPAPVAKKEKKAVKRSTQTSDISARAPTSRRISKDSHSNPNHPASKSSAQAYALDPTTNTPLIRRDFTKADGGRPKREIHPPKNKDLPYSVRPKNRKHLIELKFCEETLNEMQKPKYNSLSHPFMIPVDPVALGIPNYFAIIKKPMDISTVAKKLKDGAYLNAHEFEKDIRQIFINCYKYNPEGNPVRQMGQGFEEVFNNFWSKKDQYLADHTPSAVSLSDKDSEEEDSEDEEGPDGVAVTASLMSQKERLLEEQSKLINMMGSKHKDEGLLQMQTDLVELIQKRVKAAEEQAKKTLNKKKSTKVSKKAVPIKKSAPVKKTSTKKKYLGTLEKETISAGLSLLPVQILNNVVEMIRAENPDLKPDDDDEGTMELDIDTVSDTLLWHIHVLIMKHVPYLEAQIKESMNSESQHALRTAKPAAKKKNKPMSKHEQERKIEALTNLDSEFSRASSGPQNNMNAGMSNYMNSHVNAHNAMEQESSGDEDSDSEEE
ncbi:hypothetical protein K3495_g4436 [Podosphaera aphanis]|nr:hypothetical protein K3495_g4436 [Podosphaera aphanis]